MTREKHQLSIQHNKIIDWLTELKFYIPPDTTQVISFFPSNLLAHYWKTKLDTTKANMHP